MRGRRSKDFHRAVAVLREIPNRVPQTEALWDEAVREAAEMLATLQSKPTTNQQAKKIVEQVLAAEHVRTHHAVRP